MNNFYDKQDDLTAVKIEFYKNYIEGYLIKLLMGFKKCFIADLFCGAGKNGDKDGSPLALISKIKYILTTPKLKNSQIYILFNDKEKKNVQNLETELKKIETHESINIYPIQNKNFENILPEILGQFKNKTIPKFFFLDPFTYSNVKMNNLEEIMSLNNAEVLLFLPVFHSYRFASDKKLSKDHETRIFVEKFTTKGIYDYENVDDFVKSIKDKIKQELKLNFVRSVLLDGGSRKNALFLLTKSQEGMMLMNNLCIRKSDDGSGTKTGESYENKEFLFKKKEILQKTCRYKNFKNSLINQLREQKNMTTDKIKMFTIAEQFRPQDAKDILKELKKYGKIKFFDSNNKETKMFYMGENPKGISIFKYISEN